MIYQDYYDKIKTVVKEAEKENDENIDFDYHQKKLDSIENDV